MSSLQDQLIKAGLSSKQNARQANTDKRKKAKQKRSGQKVETSLQEQVKSELEQQKKEKAIKDKLLNDEKINLQAAKEHAQRICQILKYHSLPNNDGEIAYNYTAANKVKKLYVSNQTQSALINGQLAICYFEEKTYLVTADTAEKLNSIDNHVVVLLNKRKQDVDEVADDPYAQYQIPDDLMW
jgi:hypothetical protein